MVKKINVSRIKMDGSKFTLSDLPIHHFITLGKQHGDKSILHVVYLKKQSLGSKCFVYPKIKLSGYCSYSILGCENAGVVGVVFYTYFNNTYVNTNYVSVKRNKNDSFELDEFFTPSFTLEKLDLLLYSSNYGAVLILPTTISDESFSSVLIT